MTGLGPLGYIVGPFARTGRFYAQVWSRYLGGESADLPVVRPTPRSSKRVEREVEAALEFYDQHGWLANPDDGLVQSGLVDRRAVEA
jgi:hypothetical protein